jgi:uncharacterized protein (DUF2336 family)
MLRHRIKTLAGHIERRTDDRLGLRNVSLTQEALLVRFARSRETGLFATVLADALSASQWLSERILLDISGQQLAMTLKGLAIDADDAIFILQRLYNHLGAQVHGTSRAAILFGQLDEDECGRRVEAWRRADSYTYTDQQSRPANTASERESERGPAQVIRTTASARRTIQLQRSR